MAKPRIKAEEGMSDMDHQYLETLTRAIRICGSYKPMMGRRDAFGADLHAFQQLYQSDPFYHWFGLDNPLMYAAHKAAGGMTSIYRQIGIGVEHLFRQVLQDALRLTAEQTVWSYTTKGANKKQRKLSLDGRIDLKDIPRGPDKERIRRWLDRAGIVLGIQPRVTRNLRGVVFEVRQGYKSKDSKRQNADIANAAIAYTQAYLPCVVVLSTQIDEDIAYRYSSEKWLVLKGAPSDGSPWESTYAFTKTIVGYDLQAFFERHADELRKEIDLVLRKLLSTE